MLRSAGSRSFHKTAGFPCVRRGRKTFAKFMRKACAVRNISNISKKKLGRSCNLFLQDMTIDIIWRRREGVEPSGNLTAPKLVLKTSGTTGHLPSPYEISTTYDWLPRYP